MPLHPVKMRDVYLPHGDVTARLWLLLPLRLYVGGYLIAAAWSKVSSGLLSAPEQLSKMLRQSIEAPDYPFDFYRAFYHGMIMPYPRLFVFLVVFGELLVGIALVTGTLTRLACLAGIFMMANFYFAYNPSLSAPHATMTFATIMFVLLLTGAGKAYGIDHYLQGKAPGWMI